jgi:hypothetical protein
MKEFILKWLESDLGKVAVYSAEENFKTNENDLVIETAEQLSKLSAIYDLLEYCDANSSQAIIQALANQGKVVYSAELISRLGRSSSSASSDPYGQNWVRH